MKGFWKGRSAIVTGANGFIGSWLSRELLARGCSVIGLVKDNSETRTLKNVGIEARIILEEADIKNGDAVEKIFLKHKPDCCFHLAAKAIAASDKSDEKEFFDANVKGSYNVLKAGMNAKTKGIMLASTALVYGENRGNGAITEESLLMGKDAYAFSKICAEKIAEAFSENKGLNVATMRTSNVYGGNDHNFSRLVPGTIRKILRHENVIVHNKGESEVDLVYIEDVVEAYLLAMEKIEKTAGMKINICSGSSIKAIDAIERLISLSGRKIAPEFVSKADREVRRISLSNNLARELTGWEPKHSLESGFRETWEWYKKYLK